MARPRVHAAVTLAVLALWRCRPSWPERLAFVGGCLLVDGDHLVDLALYRRSGRRRWRVLPLHAWELAGLLLAMPRPWRRTARPAGLGLALHLLLDQLVNRPSHPAFFSLLYRLGRGFSAERLGVDRGVGRAGDGDWVRRPWWQWL